MNAIRLVGTNRKCDKTYRVEEIFVSYGMAIITHFESATKRIGYRVKTLRIGCIGMYQLNYTYAMPFRLPLSSFNSTNSPS